MQYLDEDEENPDSFDEVEFGIDVYADEIDDDDDFC